MSAAGPASAALVLRAAMLLSATLLLLVGCGAPPLTLYTLDGPAVAPDASQRRPPLGARPTVIEIVRVTVPDELDTEDIFVRDGSTLRRSGQGRWASRLSLAVTERITGRLAQRRPDALVTNRAQTDAPSYRVVVNISRLDVTTAGTATLEADWLVVPREPRLPTRRNRARFSLAGPVATDQAVVALQATLLDRLAGTIDIAGLR